MWIEQLRAGDPRALARAISVAENRSPGWSEVLKAIFPYSGHARILGLTGPPGAGKSTLVDQLARFYRKEGGVSESSQLTPPVLTLGAPSWATAYACKIIPPTPASTSVVWPHV